MKIENPYGFIYVTTNMINGKKYIGQRKFDAKCVWKYYKGSGKTFKKALKKHNNKNFVREIVAIAYSLEELNHLEIEFIKSHNAIENDDYYNIADGGKSGNKFAGKTEEEMNEIKKKMSEGTKGYHHNEAAKEKIRNAHLGKIVSEETKSKMKKNHWLKNGGVHPLLGTHNSAGKSNPMYGKKQTKESNEKNRLAHLGKKKGKDNVNAKSVVCLTTGLKFDTLVEARDYYNLKSVGNICSCCRGKMKSYGKLEDGTRLTWAYYDDVYKEVAF